MLGSTTNSQIIIGWSIPVYVYVIPVCFIDTLPIVGELIFLNEVFENNALLSLLEKIKFYGFAYCKIFYYMESTLHHFNLKTKQKTEL